MTFLVTGGAGFIGDRLVKFLLKKYDYEGNKFIFLINKNNIKYLDTYKSKNNILVKRMDLTSIEENDAIFEGVDYVFHLAAFLKYGHRDKKKYLDINLEVTKKIFSSSLFYGVKKVVYLSTAGIFHPTYHNYAHELSDINNGHTTNYTHTKYLAHLEVKKMMDKGLNIISILPVSVFGEGSPLFSGIINNVKINKLIFLPKIETRLSLVYIDDLIEGILAAFVKGEKDSYIFSGRDLSLDEIVLETAKVINKKIYIIHIPNLLAVTFFGIMSIISRILNYDFYYNKDFFSFVNGGLLADDSKARKELGFRNTNFEGNFKRMVESFYDGI